MCAVPSLPPENSESMRPESDTPDSGFFVGNPDEMRLLHLMAEGSKEPYGYRDEHRIMLNTNMVNLAEQG